MLKISETGTGSRNITLKLEGRVVGPWVGELRQVCEALLAAGGALQLDLAEVWFVDEEGVAVLSSLKTRGAVVLNCSPFVEEQLKTIDGSRPAFCPGGIMRIAQPFKGLKP